MAGKSREEINAERLLQLCDSPIEKIFYRVAWSKIPGLVPQYRVGNLRLDFAVPSMRVGIELDGYAFHHSKDQMIRDVRRQRHLMKLGWLIIRFTGSEIQHGVGLCIEEIIQIIKANCSTGSH